MGLPFQKPDARGWTIVELMMVVALIGLIVPALTSLFAYCTQGLASAEIHLQIKSLNEQMMLHLHERVNSSKHMFQDNTSSGGQNFIKQIQMGSAPASTAMSLLPLAQSGTVATFSPAAGAVSNEFGNCLFYADFDTPQTINGVNYTAPITVSGPNVVNAAGQAVTLNLDVYRFYFDYLSSAGDMKPIFNMVSYWLIEWQSVQFVDAFELEDIGSTDATLQKNVIKWLTTGSNLPGGQPMTLAWDPSQTQMTNGTSYAFYQLTTAGGMTAEPNQSILMQNWTPLSRTSSGVINAFNYGISGNYSNLSGDPPPPNVPMFAPPNASAAGFPGGFEVGLQGANGGMQVMIRSLLIARGNSRNILWDNETSVNSCRDVW